MHGYSESNIAQANHSLKLVKHSKLIQHDIQLVYIVDRQKNAI